MIQGMTPRGGARKGAGRKPAKPGKPLNQRISLMLSPEDRVHLERTAKKEKETISQAARRLIVEGLNRLRGKK